MTWVQDFTELSFIKEPECEMETVLGRTHSSQCLQEEGRILQVEREDVEEGDEGEAIRITKEEKAWEQSKRLANRDTGLEIQEIGMSLP